jgi:RNA polymerase sigma factor (sigma-70 family)
MAVKQPKNEALWAAAWKLQGKLLPLVRHDAPDCGEYEEDVQFALVRLVRRGARESAYASASVAWPTAHRHRSKPRQQHSSGPIDAPENHRASGHAENEMTLRDLLAQEQQRVILRAIMKKLPLRTRRIFRLFREEGLEHHEIAEKVNMSVGTVKEHLHRAMLLYTSELERLKKRQPYGRRP